MSRKSLTYYLVRLASWIRLSYETPKDAIMVLNEFEKMFEDDENFYPYEQWGENDKLTRKKILPFSLSAKGGAKIQTLAKESKIFQNILQSGLTEKEGKPSLLYFLTQYLVLLGNLYDWIIIQTEKSEDDPVAKNLKKKAEKIKDLSSKVNSRKIYSEIPWDKKYSKEDALKVKNRVLNIIYEVREDLKAMGELTSEEEKYFHG